MSAGTIMALMLLGALAACAPQVPLDQAEAACARQLLHWGTPQFSACIRREARVSAVPLEPAPGPKRPDGWGMP